MYRGELIIIVILTFSSLNKISVFSLGVIEIYKNFYIHRNVYLKKLGEWFMPVVSAILGVEVRRRLVSRV